MIPLNYLFFPLLPPVVDFSYQSIHAKTKQPWRHLRPLSTLRQLPKSQAALTHALLCPYNLIKTVKTFLVLGTRPHCPIFMRFSTSIKAKKVIVFFLLRLLTYFPYYEDLVCTSSTFPETTLLITLTFFSRIHPTVYRSFSIRFPNYLLTAKFYPYSSRPLSVALFLVQGYSKRVTSQFIASHLALKHMLCNVHSTSHTSNSMPRDI